MTYKQDIRKMQEDTDAFMQKVEAIQQRLGIDPDGDPEGQPGHNLHALYAHIIRLESQVGRLQEVSRKAHDAMTNWHFVHGEPSALMSPEEAEMGEACKTIAALLDEEPPQRQEISVHCDQCGGQWFWPTFNGELHLQTCHEHSDPPERDDGYTGPRIYVGGSEIRPFRDIVEDDDAR